VNQKALLHQTKEKLEEEFGMGVGIIGDGIRELTPITVGSIQTLFRNYESLKDFLDTKEVLIADEVHHATALTWYKLINVLGTCRYRFGLSATPDTGNQRMLLEAVMGRVIYTSSSKSLIKQGFLSKPTIYMIRVEGDTLPDRYDYQKAYRLGISEHVYRNWLILQLCKIVKTDSPIAVSATRINHIETLSHEFSKAKVEHETIIGNDASDARSDIFNRLKDERLGLLLISTVFDEGIDIPNIKTLILSGGGKSATRTIQRLGRGMRIDKTKRNVLVIDFWDETHDYLLKHSKQRTRTYRQEGYEVNILTLKQFFDVYNK
jgi:superfamily II DNA or RNA helicase